MTIGPCHIGVVINVAVKSMMDAVIYAMLFG
jgi:hypothetical protein